MEGTIVVSPGLPEVAPENAESLGFLSELISDSLGRLKRNIARKIKSDGLLCKVLPTRTGLWLSNHLGTSTTISWGLPIGAARDTLNLKSEVATLAASKSGGFEAG